MAQATIRYLVTLVIFLVLDSLWLGVIADGFYRERIGHLMGPVNWQAAVLFYLIYVAGIIYFVLEPALRAGGKLLSTAAKRGGAFGAVAYATYDLTNLATLRGWPVDMVILDICWGTALTAAVATAGCFVIRKMEWG